MNIDLLAIKFLAWRARAFEASTKEPLRAQEKVLFEYLGRNKNTEYGRKYNFAGIRSIRQFQSLIPLCDSETIRTYISRMAKGEQNILTIDKPIFFGITSGTTDKPKLIPVTKFSRDRKAALMDLWSYYIARDYPDILDGKVLAVISPEKEGMTESGLLFGAESGHAYKNMSFAVRHLYALPYHVFDIGDFETRYYCILRIGIEKNITTVATLNPSTLIILCQKIKQWQDGIIDDIEKGTLNRRLTIPGDIRRKIEKTLKPNPEKAACLRRLLVEKGALLPKYVWPNLKLIECWKGGTVKLYLKELPRYFGDIPVRDIGCLSTESRSSIPISDKGAGGILTINTNFYEFIPKEDMNKKTKRFLLCTELEKGREYFMVVTTPGGLYRYNTDDIITVDGFFNSTPVIEFMQKGHNATSLAGEKLYESQVNEAINKVAERYKLAFRFFSAFADATLPPKYVFFMELNDENIPLSKKDLLAAIEKELRSELLAPPVLRIIKQGGYERYRARKIREGSHDSQFKAPELVSDPEFQHNFEISEEIRSG
jgi:hypothetical protein